MSKSEINMLMDRLKEMHDDIKDLREMVVKDHGKISKIEGKAAAWGTLGGTVVGGVVAAIIESFKR